MRQEGLLLTCDRCGKQIMLTEKLQHNTDGGFTKNFSYSDEPEDWAKHEGKDICDECNKDYEKMINKFYHDVEFEKHIREEKKKNGEKVIRDPGIGIW